MKETYYGIFDVLLHHKSSSVTAHILVLGKLMWYISWLLYTHKRFGLSDNSLGQKEFTQ